MNLKPVQANILTQGYEIASDLPIADQHPQTEGIKRGG